MKLVWPTFSVLAFALLGASSVACSDPPPDATNSVGPAPLRRLTNREYLNALADLFPTASSLLETLPPLPNDSSVAGFDNAAEVQQPSDVRIARYETIANVYAAELTQDRTRLEKTVGCTEWATPSQENACAASFITTLGGRLFRRPLTAAERDRFERRFRTWQASTDFAGAVRLTLSTMLQAPQFLYRPEPLASARGNFTYAAVDAYAMASRLSFFLWESVPDDALLSAAARNELHSDADVRSQAKRMLDDPRARRVLWSFHRQWLGLDRILTDEHTYRTPAVDSAWTAASAASAYRESQLFVENLLAQGGSFQDLFTSRRAWVDGEMARLYRVEGPGPRSTWNEVQLVSGERAGILTRIAFLAANSHRGATSPPVRGSALLFHALCRLPSSPPPGADLSMPVAAPGEGPKTNRMLFAARTAPATCQGCHRDLNALGFGFENYSAAGAFRTQEENGLPIDANGHIYGTDVDQNYTGAVALSQALGRSKMVYDCAVRQWVRYALGRAPTEEERPLVKELSGAFFASQGDVRALLLSIAASPTFRLQKVDAR